jgi:NADH dehydrogenase
MRVLVTGSTGFVGRHVVAALIRAGHKVRCLHRETSDLGPLRGMDVELSAGDVLRPETLTEAVDGMDAVVHLVAILREREATFEDVNVEGVRNVLEACRASGVEALIHMGALGTSPDSASRYARCKAEGERLVWESGMQYAILRPALILGPGGDFTERMGELVRRNRRVPIIGSGRNLLQPIYVEDVAEAVVAALEERAQGRSWELGGPERLTLEDLVLRIAKTMGLKRSIRHVSPRVARLLSRASSLITGEPLVTEDELILMQEDILCDPEEFVKLTGRTPTDLDVCLERSFAQG